jgi:pilus assembly protein CpaE
MIKKGGDLYMEELAGEKQGKMAVFVSSKGGVGKTVTAVNTAAALASRGFSTCIFDGSFQFGDVNLALDIQPRFTVSDMVLKDDYFDGSRLSNYLHTHESGLKVLSAPLKPELADLVTAPMIPVICKNILEVYQYLVVDLTTGISEISLSFMEMADLIFVVTDLELSSIKNTKIMLRTLEKLDMGEKLKVIVNRSDSKTLTKASQVPDILEIDEVSYVAEDSKVVSKSLNIGIPFVISAAKEKITSDILSVIKAFEVTSSYVKRGRNQKRAKIRMLSR